MICLRSCQAPSLQPQSDHGQPRRRRRGNDYKKHSPSRRLDGVSQSKEGLASRTNRGHLCLEFAGTCSHLGSKKQHILSVELWVGPSTGHQGTLSLRVADTSLPTAYTPRTYPHTIPSILADVPRSEIGTPRETEVPQPQPQIRYRYEHLPTRSPPTHGSFGFGCLGCHPNSLCPP